MTRIVVDDALRAALRQFAEPLELCDENGQVLAKVFPHIDMSQYEPLEPEISEEELQRREKSNKWYTTAEVLARLKSLEN